MGICSHVPPPWRCLLAGNGSCSTAQDGAVQRTGHRQSGISVLLCLQACCLAPSGTRPKPLLPVLETNPTSRKAALAAASAIVVPYCGTGHHTVSEAASVPVSAMPCCVHDCYLAKTSCLWFALQAWAFSKLRFAGGQTLPMLDAMVARMCSGDTPGVELRCVPLLLHSLCVSQVCSDQGTYPKVRQEANIWNKRLLQQHLTLL